MARGNMPLPGEGGPPYFTIPLAWTQGETMKWDRHFETYPSGLWTIQYLLLTIDGVTSQQIDGTANSDGSFTFAILPDMSLAWAWGSYLWNAMATNIADPTNVIRVDSGNFFMKPTLGRALAPSHAQSVLTALEATIENRASEEFASITVNGVAITEMAMPQLLDAYNQYKFLVQAEKNKLKVAMGLGSRRTHRYRFTPWWNLSRSFRGDGSPGGFAGGY